MTAPALLPLREVERRLGLTRWTLYQLIRRGELPAIRLGSGHYRVSVDVVEAMAAGRPTRTSRQIGDG